MARHHLPHDGRGHRDGKALPGEGPARAAHPRPAEVQDRAALAALTEAEGLEVDGFYELMI